MTSDFKAAIDKQFGSFLETENFKHEYTIQESNEKYVAEIYASPKAKLRLYYVEHRSEIGIDVAKPDAISLSEFDQHGQKIWHDTYDLMPEGWDTRTEEELLAAIPDTFPTTEEQLINQRDFLLEHHDKIMSTFNKLNQSVSD